MLSVNKINRRALLLYAVSMAAVSNAMAKDISFNWSRKNLAGGNQYLVDGSVIREIYVLNDISINSTIMSQQVECSMQTNGCVLKIITNGIGGQIDLSKIQVETLDPGHDKFGRLSSVSRIIGVRDLLRGPHGTPTYYSPSPYELYLVLDDRLFNQDAAWRTQVVNIVFDQDWVAGQPKLTIDGASVQRLDSLSYLPFPVKTPTPPFGRAGNGSIAFEVSGVHHFARDRNPFACVEAWAHVGGLDGPVARCSDMARSIETNGQFVPSGIPAPVYTLRVDTSGLPDGPGEIRYVAKPWIGPAWVSTEKGEDYPTPNAPRGLPFVNDASGSYAPIFGIVAQNGAGSDGSLLTGLSGSIEGALASGVVYRDPAAVAKAVRTLNRAAATQTIADGQIRRAIPHDDIAGGVAVLVPVAGSQLGQNAGSYAIRTSMAAGTTFPTGATCFEIRSQSGLPSDDVRLRGVLPTGTAPASKAVPARLILRGVTLDGTATTSTQNIVIDGTAAAGAAATKPSVLACAYLISIDTRILENQAAGTSNAARYRSGLMWDVRVAHQWVSGLGALAANPALHSALVASIGSAYDRSFPGSALSTTCLLGVKSRNIPVVGQSLGAQPTFTGQLMCNVRINYDTAFTSPAVNLAGQRPSKGGLGLCNVFAKGSVDSGGPLIQIGADGTFAEIDNAIIFHSGNYLVNRLKISNGRANIIYQDQGYIRINKIGNLKYNAFSCYSTKGDSFPATNVPITATFWSVSNSYYKGKLVYTKDSLTGLKRIYQALTDVSILAPEIVDINDSFRWMDCGVVSNIAFGSQPRRQGNANIRYHIGSNGNVANTTYNTSPLSTNTSGYGFSWGADELINADIAKYYVNPYDDNFSPQSPLSGGVLYGRVAAGMACVPFDLAGNPRHNDGTGAAGAYEYV